MKDKIERILTNRNIPLSIRALITTIVIGVGMITVFIILAAMVVYLPVWLYSTIIFLSMVYLSVYCIMKVTEE